MSGRKVLVAGGASCDTLIVSALLEGDVGLFLIDINDPGVSARPYESVDGRPYADFAFSDVSIGKDAFLGVVTEQQIDDALDEARLYICADMIGGLDRAIELTVDYLKTRSQFGQPLSDFQVIQHTIANMFVEVEGARSSLLRALSFPVLNPGFRRAVSGCWVKTFDVAKDIAGMGVHLHGAIGFTTEYEVGHYLRRAIVNERLFGDVELHLDRYMAAGE